MVWGYPATLLDRVWDKCLLVWAWAILGGGAQFVIFICNDEIQARGDHNGTCFILLFSKYTVHIPVLLKALTLVNINSSMTPSPEFFFFQI